MLNLEKIQELTTSQNYDMAVSKLAYKYFNTFTYKELCEYWACVKLVPEENLKTNPLMCFIMIQIHVWNGDTALAKKWLFHLSTLKKSQSDVQIEYYSFGAHCILPDVDNANLLLCASILYNDLLVTQGTLDYIEMSCLTPSVLKGFKDFSDFSKNYKAVASIMKPMIQNFQSDQCVGFIEVATAEYLYLRNDMTGASTYVAGALDSKNPYITITALFMLARIARVDVTNTSFDDILNHIVALKDNIKLEYLFPVVDSIIARFNIVSKKTKEVEDWLDSSEINYLNGFCVRYYFELVTQSKAHIFLGNYSNAITILERLTSYLRNDIHTLDLSECLANCAVACYYADSKELAFQKLLEALTICQAHGYIRVFSDLNEWIKPLFKEFYTQLVEANINSKYIHEIIGPLDDTTSQNDDGNDNDLEDFDALSLMDRLTEMEVEVLLLVNEGKTNAQIAKKFSIQQGTVKFHISNVLKKLSATNRVQALAIAKANHII